MKKEVYDVYYSTGGGDLDYGGADLWVNHWIENIAPKLKVKPVLAIHRKSPTKRLSKEQKRAFESSVKKGTGGNEGRKINVGIRENFKKSLEKKDKVYKELEKTKSWEEIYTFLKKQNRTSNIHMQEVNAHNAAIDRRKNTTMQLLGMGLNLAAPFFPTPKT